MARQFEEEVTIVGVPSQDTEDAMADFVERHDLGHVPQAVDMDRVAWGINDIPAQPAWVFIDGETGESERFLGELSEDELAERVSDLIDGS